MFFRKQIFFINIICLLLFSSCGIKYYKLSKKEFPQGKDLSKKRKKVQKYLKTKRILNQFETEAIFDVLYLSDEVKTIYVDVLCSKKGKNEQEKDALLRQELDDNKKMVSFCILSDVRSKGHISLTDKNSLWSFYLETQDGKKIVPEEIKEVELAPEYQFFFGHRFNSFKRYYHFKFAASEMGKYIDSAFKMVIASPFKEREIIWNRKIDSAQDKKRKILKDEDFYWV